MKHSLLFSFFLLISFSVAFAQPANDECSTAINLGTVPAACQPNQIYTNQDATESNIGAANNPTCFVGGLTRRDVWFAFTSASAVENYVISLQGVNTGPNQRAIRNPQISVYRGTCDGLSELLCISAPNNASSLELPLFNLLPDLTYYIRVNDYTATATPNSGDFTLCVNEYVPEVIMGETTFTEACSGTLFDSGGPNGRYGNNEDLTFTICPQQQSSCIKIDVVDFDIEFSYDLLTIYEGANINGPIIARVTGINAGNVFPIQSSSGCVTIRFQSDLFIRSEGFELRWECASASCLPTSLDAPTQISSLPFNGSFTTCDVAASFSQSPCSDVLFLNGPEHVFTYQSAGDECISINLTGATAGTGVLLLDGPPTDAASTCIAMNENGVIRTARLSEAGTYYIVVANTFRCTNFSIRVEAAECALSPGLVDALCNPLNGCAGDEPSIFIFQDGFQDIEITNANRGCWLGFGVQPDFYWFTIEAQATGKFGFIIESADAPSDIDFSVWGPFNQNAVCNDRTGVINFIESNQPIRSSWSPTAGKTGMAAIHPILGTPIQDAYDCGSTNTPGDGGDDFVRPIDAREGEVYVVLINDWGNQIQNNGVAVDWSPSDAAVIGKVNAEIVLGDTAICQGDSVQIVLETGINNIKWFPSETLSCDDCPNPIAFPTTTTTYRAIIDGICTMDTVQVEVQVYNLDAGPTRTVCLGETFVLEAGVNFEDATYQWIVPSGITFSCTDCPNPTVTAIMEGTYDIGVNLNAPTCPLSDMVQIVVLPQQAPQFSVSDSFSICIGDTVELGSDDNPAGQTYEWTSRPTGFTSNERNPTASPTTSTTYFVSVMNNTCPTPSLDSVFVQVSTRPELLAAQDTMLCLGDSLQLGFSPAEPNTTYLWTGPGRIDDTTNPTTSAVPQFSGLYVLTAERDACTAFASFNVEVTQIAVEIQNGDTARVCKGDELILTTNVIPANAQPIWSSNDGNLSDTIGTQITLTPTRRRMYFAEVTVDACVRIDSILVIVDSLPTDLSIMPMDTSVCEGSMVELTSTIYEPSEFPDIKFLWEPPIYQQTPDSLYNMVVQPLDTTEYTRITTNGACIDTARATIIVNPIPIITVDPSDTIVCPGSPVRLVASSTEEIETWMWTPEQGLSSTESQAVTATAFSTVTYTVTGETPEGCPGSGSASITVVSEPIINITPAEPVLCVGEEITISAQILPVGLNFTWTSPDDPDLGTVTTPTITVSPDVTSTYILTVNTGCGTFTREVTVPVIADAQLTVSTASTICEGESVTLTARGDQPGNYTWTANGIAISNEESVTVRPLETTTYQILYQSACIERMGEVTVTVLPVDSILDISDDVTICVGETINLFAQVEAGADFEWTSTDPNFGTATTLNISVSPSATATYTLTIDNGDCGTISRQVTVTVIDNATVQVTGGDNVCEDDRLTFTAAANAPGTFRWSTGKVDVNVTTSTETILFQQPGAVQEFVIYENECGATTLPIPVTVVPRIDINAVTAFINNAPIDTMSVNVGDEIQIEAFTIPSDLSGYGNVTYTWTQGGNPVGGNSNRITTRPEEAGEITYVVTITTEAGCSATGSVTITVNPVQIRFPNVFNPNSTVATNRVFRAFYSGNYQLESIKIYNRWGQVVFESDNIDFMWDGTKNGAELPSDLYIYVANIITPTGQEQVIRGEVLLLR